MNIPLEVALLVAAFAVACAIALAWLVAQVSRDQEEVEDLPSNVRELEPRKGEGMKIGLQLTLEEADALAKLLSHADVSALHGWEQMRIQIVRRKVNKGLNLAAEQGWLKEANP